jgi:hypothetical protein
MRLSFLAISLMMLLGCSTTPSVASSPSNQESTGTDDYRAQLSHWTRSDRVYRGFDTQLFVTATFHTPELRRTFAVAFPDIYGHGGTITKRELVELTGDVERFHNFFVAAYTPDDKWNDLDQPDSIWRLRLSGAQDVAVDPAMVESIKIDANIRQVYPYLSRFDKAYIARFPLADAMNRLVVDSSTTVIKLRIASALGVAEMSWDLEPSPSSP